MLLCVAFAVLSACAQVCSNFLRVLTMRSVRPYLEPRTVQRVQNVAGSASARLGHTFNSVKTLVEEDNERVAIRIRRIEEAYRDNYAEVLRDAEVLRPLHEIYRYCKSWTIDSYCEAEPTVRTCTPALCGGRAHRCGRLCFRARMDRLCASRRTSRG